MVLGPLVYLFIVTTMETKDSVQPTNYLLSPNRLSITSIHLNGSNNAQWTQAVEVFLPDRKKFNNVINDPRVYNLHTLNMLIGE